MAVTTIPKRMSAYTVGCVLETAEDVYGRDNRRPIHDAIRYITDMTLTMNKWCSDLGLCIQDEKLCVIYNSQEG